MDGEGRREEPADEKDLYGKRGKGGGLPFLSFSLHPPFSSLGYRCYVTNTMCVPLVIIVNTMRINS